LSFPSPHPLPLPAGRQGERARVRGSGFETFGKIKI